MPEPSCEHPLVAEGLTKVIGKRVIVDDVSFTVGRGEVFGFLGPNGAGKTTTIRMLVGLIRPTRGRALVCGHDVRREFRTALRYVGCIVETPDLYRYLTGRENLEHFARMLGGVTAADIERVATLVVLEHRLDDRVGTYSLGMRQRLGIAQALLGSPRVLILDEPANGLDPAGIREMRNLLRRLAVERGISILVSSHLLSEIELMCDRVAIIHRGKILREGRVADLIAEHRQLEIRAENPDRAAFVLDQMQAIYERVDSGFVTRLDDVAIPDLVDRLSAAGARVVEIRQKTWTLEDAFLETTGGETVD